MMMACMGIVLSSTIIKIESTTTWTLLCILIAMLIVVWALRQHKPWNRIWLDKDDVTEMWREAQHPGSSAAVERHWFKCTTRIESFERMTWGSFNEYWTANINLINVKIVWWKYSFQTALWLQMAYHPTVLGHLQAERGQCSDPMYRSICTYTGHHLLFIIRKVPQLPVIWRLIG